MPRLPVLSGDELIKALQKAGFEVVRRKGSAAGLLTEAEFDEKKKKLLAQL